MLTATNIEEIFRVCDAFRRESEIWWDLLIAEPAEENRRALKAVHEISKNCQTLKSWCSSRAQTLDQVGPDALHPAEQPRAVSSGATDADDGQELQLIPESVKVAKSRLDAGRVECVGSSDIRVSAMDTNAWEGSP